MSGPDLELRQLAARIFGEELPELPTVDTATALIRTEALLNARATFERAMARGPIEPAEDEPHWEVRMEQRAYQIFLEADRLFADLIGETAFKTIFPDDPSSQSASMKRWELARRLSVFKRLLSEPRWGEVLRALTLEIRDMDGGDQPNVLYPERRSPGQAKQPTKVARMRLRALCWHEHLRSKGIETNRRQTAIASAYRTAWDSIRRWRDSCETVFGKQDVATQLRYASHDWYWDWSDEGIEWAAALETDGGDYYETWRHQRGKSPE